MLGNFEILFLPNNLRVAAERAASSIKSINYDVLYLNVPRELNWLVDELALGAPYESFIEKVKETNILREPITSWEYKFEPILLALRGLKLRKPSLRIICYGNSAFENLSTRIAEKIAVLVLRVNVTGRVDVAEWRKIVSALINVSSNSINEEDNYILETWMSFHNKLKAMCIKDYSARGLAKRARKLGIRVVLRYSLKPYIFTPLEVLIREFTVANERGLDISDRRVENLVKMYAIFIRNYVVASSNYDEAYFRWLKDGQYRQYLVGEQD